MNKNYIDHIDGEFRVAGTRVSLESVLMPFLEGLSPEVIAAECFPVLTLEQVYGAITFYLANRAEIDSHIKHMGAEYDTLRRSVNTSDPAFSQKMARIMRATTPA